MGKQQQGCSLASGAGAGFFSSLPGNDDDDEGGGSSSVWLSLGSIYNSAVVDPAGAAPASALLDHAGSCSRPAAVPAGMMPHPADGSFAADAGVPVPAFFATGVLAQAQIASSPSIQLVDGNCAAAAASPVRFSSLPISSPVLIVAPSAAISLPARQVATAMPAAAPAPVNRHDVQAPPAPPLPACTEHRSHRQPTSGAPQAPVVVDGGSSSGSPSPADSNGATGGHVSGPPSPPLPARTAESPTCRRRRANTAPQEPVVGGGDPPTTPPPFPWATNRPAIHYSIPELAARGITAVEGEVQCSKCDVRKTIAYDVAAKFAEVRAFVVRNIHDMDDRAPEEWSSTKLSSSDCADCGQRRCVRPVIPPEHERINWVFMLLGQTLGLLKLDQLKHFCAHAKQHRTGAKDRVLYSTYMALCRQLSPGDRLFNVTAERKKRSRHYYA